ncbi:MAG: hypothetical protein OEU89_01170 [Burkholderiaceae bacterium]|nr:hypothetical protein [Burkholderiaceae bacterium]
MAGLSVGALAGGAAGGAAGRAIGATADGGAGCATGGRGGACGGSGGAEAQPASAAATAGRHRRRFILPWLLQCDIRPPCPAMFWLLLEAALALGIFVLLVWWTMFHRPRRKPGRDR